MSKVWKLISLMLLSFAFVAVVGVVGAKAADTTIDGKLTVTGDIIAKYPIYAEGNKIDFKGDAEMLIEMDYGSSQRRIKSNSSGMYIYTYSDLHLDNGGIMYVHKASSFGGVADFTAGLTSTTGAFSGAVSGTTGTFTGAVSGTTGTFSGAVTGSTGTFASGLLGHTAATAPTTALGEGAIYYDTAANLMYYNTGTAAVPVWVQFDAGTAVTLDAAYNASGGASTVSVDAGNVTWDLTNGSDYIIDIASATSTFEIEDAGVDAWVWDSDGLLDITDNSAGGDIIDVTRAATSTGDVFDVNMGAGATAGDALDISWGAAGTGNSINVNNGANLAGNMVNLVGTGVRTGNQIDITTDETGAGEIIDINVDGLKTAAGDVIDITFGTAASLSDAIDLNMGTNVAGDGLRVDTAGTTGSAIDIASTGVFSDALINVATTAAWTGNLMDVDVGTAIATGNVLDVTYADVAQTGNAIDLNMATNVAGDAINIATAATTGSALEIDATGVFTANLVDIDTTAAFTTNVIDITTATAASTGNLIDLNFGNIADTGDAINIAMGATAVGAQALVIDTSAGIRTTNAIAITDNNTSGVVATIDYNTAMTRGGFLDIDTTGILATENLIDITTTAAWTSNLISLTTGAQAATGNYIDINVGSAAQTGNAIDIAMGAAAVGFQGFVMDTSAGIRTASALQITENNTTGAVATIDWDSAELRGGFMDIDFTGALATENLIDIDATGAWTSDLFDITTGGGVATGNIMHVTNSGADVDVQTLVVDNAAISAQPGWLMDINTTAAWTANMIDFTAGAQAWTGNLFNVTTGGGVSTGDVINITNTVLDAATQAFVMNNAAISTSAGWLMDINTTAAWTGNMIDITTGAQATTGNYIDINPGDAAHTGDILNVAIPASAIAMQNFVVTNAAISNAAANTGWLLDVNSTAAQAGNWIDFDSTAAWTGNMFAVDNSGNAIWTGNIIDITTGTGDASGNMIDLAYEALATDAQGIVANNAAASDQAGWLIDANVTGATTVSAIDINDDATQTGDGINLDYATLTTGNVMRLQDTAGLRTTGHVLAIDDAGDATLTSGSTVHISQSSAASTQTVLELDFIGVGAANEGMGLDITHATTPLAANANAMRVSSDVANTAASNLVEFSSTGKIAGATNGVVLNIEETGAATITSYAVNISSTNNEALRINTGLVLLTEGGSVGPLNWADGAGVAAAYTMDLNPDMPGTVAVAGTMLIMTNAGVDAAGGATTLQVDGGNLDPVKVVDTGGAVVTNPAAFDISDTGANIFISDGTNWILINPNSTTGE